MGKRFCFPSGTRIYAVSLIGFNRRLKLRSPIRSRAARNEAAVLRSLTGIRKGAFIGLLDDRPGTSEP